MSKDQTAPNLALDREKQTLVLTIIDTNVEYLTTEEAKAFADALLVERKEQNKWIHDGTGRTNLNRINVYYVC